MSDRAIRSILVAGGGIVALTAAVAFARALPGATITLVETSPDPAALADVLPVSLAAGRRLHKQLGIDDAALMATGIAAPFLGTELQGWSASGAPWWLVLGPYGKPAGAVAFDQLWVAAHDAGRALPYDRYAVGAALARAGKFITPASDPEFIGSRFEYGLALDPEGYRGQLSRIADAAGVGRRPGDIGEVERREGRVSTLQLRDGSRLAADLFVDCTGPSAVIAGALTSEGEHWSGWLPFDRITLREADDAQEPGPADRVRADADGWTGHYRTGSRAVRARLSTQGGAALTYGRRTQPWTGNVLALGEAATSFDPLHRLNLDSAHQALLLALELLPGRDFATVETDEYNRRSEQVTRRLRDFLALHYLRSGRGDSSWDRAAALDPPDSLARTLDQYSYRARLPFHEDETISRDQWAAALLGLGVIPSHLDPQVLNLPLDQAWTAMDSLAREIDQAVDGVPA